MSDTTSPTKLALDTLDAVLSDVEDMITYAQNRRDNEQSPVGREHWRGRCIALYDLSELLDARIATLKDEE